MELEEGTDNTSRSAMTFPQLSEAKDRAPINVLANGLWLLINVGVNLWYVPFLVNHLGVGVYGLIPLATSLTKYMTVITDGFNGAVSRFLTIDLAQNDVKAANSTFNTAIFGSGFLTVILLPIIIILAILTPQLFNIPSGQTQDAQRIVFLVMVAFLTATFASNFAVSSFAYHRFDLRFLVNLLRVFTEVGTIILLFQIFSPRLWLVGFGMAIASLFLLGGHTIIWRRLTPQLSISISSFNWFRLRKMLGFSGWVLVNQVGSLLFLNIDLLVANLLFGATVGGRYGAVIVFPTLLRSLAATVNGILIPVIISLYAQQRIDELLKLSKQAVKLMGLLMALPIGLLCGLGRPFLSLWLGPEFSDLSWLVILLVAHLSINTAIIPLFSLQVATNRVRLPAIVTLGSGVLNTILALSLARWSGLEYLGIAAAGAIVLTVKNGIFTTWYGAHILNLPPYTFVRSVSTGGFSCLLVGIFTYILNSYFFMVDSWLELVLIAGLITLLYLISAYRFGLNQSERKVLLNEFQRRF